MQKDNFRKDHKLKALIGFVGLLAFAVAMRIWPPEQTRAQVGVLPVSPVAVDVLSDSAIEAQKAALKAQNRAKDSLNLIKADKLGRINGEVKLMTAANKRRAPKVLLTSEEMIYFRKDGEIIFEKPIVRDGKFLIVDWDATSSEIARIEAVADTLVSEPQQTAPTTSHKPEPKRTKIGQFIYNTTHIFDKKR